MRAKVLLASILAFSVMAGGVLGLVMSETSEGANINKTGVVGVPIEISIGRLQASSGTNDGMPSWITSTANANTVIFSGTPPSAGVFTWTHTRIGGMADGTTETITLTIKDSFDFENAPPFDMLVGDGLSYQANTNLPATFTRESGASWVTVSSSGLVTGTAPSPGTHTVTIKATSTSGPVQTATQTLTIYVYDVLAFTSVPSTGGIAYSEYSYTPTATIDSNFSVSGLPTGAVYQDGKIRWVPLVAGDYSFTVTATSKVGPLQTVTETVSFTIYPKLSFTTIPTADMVVMVNGSALQFYSMSIDTTSVLWDFGDGTTSDEFYPVHSYGSPGEYTVTLTAYNSVGESVTTKSIAVTGDTGDPLTIEPYKLLFVFVIVILAVLALFGKFSGKFGGNKTKKGRR